MSQRWACGAVTLLLLASLLGACADTSTTTTRTVTSVSPTTSSTLPALPPGLPSSARALKGPILTYHYVDATPPVSGPFARSLTVRTTEFETQMEYLAKHGFHPVLLEQVYAAMAGGLELPSKPVVITFDDGGKDNFTVAYPILRAHNFVATFFVATGLVGGSAAQMTWDDLREMQSKGMAIESHSVTHKDLAHAEPAVLKKELVESRQAILEELGRESLVICWPGGLFDKESLAAARPAGYLMGVSTQGGIVLYPRKVFYWPRVRVYPGMDTDKFAALLE